MTPSMRMLNSRAHCIRPSNARSSSSRRIPFRRAIAVSASNEQVVSNTAEALPSTSTSGLTYTNLECNSFAVKLNASGVQVLVDPWLTGELVFADQSWLFRAKKRMLAQAGVDIDAIAADTDILLITQMLPDHFHPPTLRLLPKSLPVVGPPEVAQMARELGFTDVTGVDHGQTVGLLGGRLTVQGTAGALVGPPWSKRQNGFVLRDGGVSLYTEPHCDFVAASLASVAPVDVVVSPVASQLLDLGALQYPLVMGDIALGHLMQVLRPKVLIPLANAEIDQEGPLADLILERGTLQQAQQVLEQSGLSTRIVLPGPAGQATPIEV